MAGFISTNFSHTYAGQEFLTEFFFQPQSTGRNPFELFRVMSNIDSKKNIYIHNALSKVVRKYTTCGFVSAGTSTISDKVIDVTKIKLNLSQCEDAFDDTALGELRKKGTDVDNLLDTELEAIMTEQVMTALMSDIPRIVWMSKSTSFSSDWDHFDGFFDLFFDASATLTCALDMSTDTDIETSSSDDTLVTDGALVALRQLWTDQGAPMRAIPKSDKKFYVTSTIFDNILETYENTGTDVGLTRLEDGRDNLQFRGVDVVEMTHWDDTLADVDNPMQALIGNNAIVYTLPEFLIIGTDINDPTAELKIFHDEQEEELRYKLKMKLGVQFVHDEYVCFAF